MVVQLVSPKFDQNTHEEKCWLLSSEESQKQSPRRVVLAINNPSHFEFALYEHGRESSVTLADSEEKGKKLEGGKRDSLFFLLSGGIFLSLNGPTDCGPIPPPPPPLRPLLCKAPLGGEGEALPGRQGKGGEVVVAARRRRRRRRLAERGGRGKQGEDHSFKLCWAVRRRRRRRKGG